MTNSLFVLVELFYQIVFDRVDQREINLIHSSIDIFDMYQI